MPSRYKLDHSYSNHFKMVVMFFISLVLPFVAASGSHPFDFGDFLALVIVMALAFGGVCACLGKYARIRAGESTF